MGEDILKKKSRCLAEICTCFLCIFLMVICKQFVTLASETADDDPERELILEQTEEIISIATTSRAAENSSGDLEVKAYGIDVSKYQGDIDWEKVKEAGVTFAIIRVGYRGYSKGIIVQDEYAIANIEGALSAGIEVGVYFFSTALNEEEAIEEAEFVLSIIEDYDITYPIVYDCEGYENSSYRNYGLSNTTRTNNAITYLDYVVAAGYQGMMYGSSSRLENENSWETGKLEEAYDIWVAQYPYYTYSSASNYTLYPSYAAIGTKTTSYSGTYRIWQCSSQGVIDGIDVYVDLDIEYEMEPEELQTSTYSWIADADGKTYYCKDGVVQKGWRTINGNKYFFSRTTGEMQTGWATIDGKIYYFNENGTMHKGWRTINGNKYFFSRMTGEMQTGWATIDGKTYYFNENGTMHKGWRTINGNKYFFSRMTGEMQTGLTTVDDYRYYFSDGGALQKGWRTINGNKYFFSRMTGEMQTGRVTIDGKTYYFNENGTMHKGWRTINGNKYYFSRTTGEIQTGLTVVDGKSYYFNANGTMHKGWRTISGSKYFFSRTTGEMQIGWVTVEGRKYYFDSSGKLTENQ